MYSRDTTGAVINVDDSHYKAVVAAREIKKMNSTLVEDLANIKDEMKAIRDQFLHLLESSK